MPTRSACRPEWIVEGGRTLSRYHLTIALSLLTATGLLAQESPTAEPAGWFTAENATAELLILGTFHFKDAGLDGYKPEVDIDILSPERQTELEALLDRLAAFKPTKVLIEVKQDRQPVFDERYSAYQQGDYELPANEVYQVGFRLAKRLGHQRVYAIDVLGRSYGDLPDATAYARENGQQALLDNAWDGRYEALYRYGDHLKARHSLIDHLLYLNSEERLRQGHGHYVLSDLALGQGDEYPRTDNLTGWWYNRNLRIYSNVLRVMEPGDRLLLLIGAGHVPIIRHAAQASPEIHLLDVAEVLVERPR
jgi:hypothetical protein